MVTVTFPATTNPPCPICQNVKRRNLIRHEVYTNNAANNSANFDEEQPPIYPSRRNTKGIKNESRIEIFRFFSNEKEKRCS